VTALGALALYSLGSDDRVKRWFNARTNRVDFTGLLFILILFLDIVSCAAVGGAIVYSLARIQNAAFWQGRVKSLPRGQSLGDYPLPASEAWTGPTCIARYSMTTACLRRGMRMADRSRGPTIGCFAASNLSGRPSRQVSTTKRSLVARLPWAHAIRLQQLHQLLSLLCVFSNSGNLFFAQS
jgi:hypothetical protein